MRRSSETEAPAPPRSPYAERPGRSPRPLRRNRNGEQDAGQLVPVVREKAEARVEVVAVENSVLPLVVAEPHVLPGVFEALVVRLVDRGLRLPRGRSGLRSLGPRRGFRRRLEVDLHAIGVPDQPQAELFEHPLQPAATLGDHRRRTPSPARSSAHRSRTRRHPRGIGRRVDANVAPVPDRLRSPLLDVDVADDAIIQLEQAHVALRIAVRARQPEA